MRWVGWLNERAGRDPTQRVKGVKDSFLPREWDAFFGGLTPEGRRAASARLCRNVLATVSLPGEAIEQAITALAHGQMAAAGLL
jgi:hypothetical protein